MSFFFCTYASPLSLTSFRQTFSKVFTSPSRAFIFEGASFPAPSCEFRSLTQLFFQNSQPLSTAVFSERRLISEQHLRQTPVILGDCFSLLPIFILFL